MQSKDIRQRYLDFFKERGHTIVPSSSLVPANDPTLLFTNAGMNQFKDIFLGQEKRPYTKATSAQRVMRAGGKHNDLENVGLTKRHLTFFEMLGNFSFGDYFKREAISFAWDFVTKELKLDPNLIWPTVFRDDEEAVTLWQEISGLPPERISRLGEADNFWSMGDTGPCGPCSEIYYDRGAAAGCGQADCAPGHADDCERFTEFWNLVFMQYNQNGNGQRTPLPRPSIDTGMGFERIAAIMQGVDNVFDTDLFTPIIQRTRELLNQDEAHVAANIIAYRVIADHTRSLTFLIGDGVLPGNEGRSYVLRRILRRAVRFGRQIGFDQPFLAETAKVVIAEMGDHYPEIRHTSDFIMRVLTHEEEQFKRTLLTGTTQFNIITANAEKEGRQVITGQELFTLYDTYGLPVDIAEEYATDKGMTVERKIYEQIMQERSHSQSTTTFKVDQRTIDLYNQLNLAPTEFIGYQSIEGDALILAIIQEGQAVEVASPGSEVQVILDRTPFYAEGGGQIGDTGYIESQSGRAEVVDCFRPVPAIQAHKVKISDGSLRRGDVIRGVVNRTRRNDIRRNHSATHILHKAIRSTLGEHAQQAGSLVAPDRLRFDFNHLSALAPEELLEIEMQVNEQIRANLPVDTDVTTYDEARQRGAVALFGEKYGANVRMVSIDAYSRELCGGTHVHYTGEIGSFYILSETSVAQGVRRIEAVTGRGAEELARTRLRAVSELGLRLRVRPHEVTATVTSLLEDRRRLEREITQLQSKMVGSTVDDIIAGAHLVNNTRVVATVVSVPEVDMLMPLADKLRDKLRSGIIFLGYRTTDNKATVMAIVTPDKIQEGYHAGNLIREATAILGGKGGGTADHARGGAPDAAKLDLAIAAVPDLVGRQFKG